MPYRFIGIGTTLILTESIKYISKLVVFSRPKMLSISFSSSTGSSNTDDDNSPVYNCGNNCHICSQKRVVFGKQSYQLQIKL